MTQPTIRERILAALVAGEEISANDFAHKIGANSTFVTSKLRGLAPWLERRREAGSNGRVFYSAGNVHALQEKLDAEVNARLGIEASNAKFDGLCAAWGIKARHIALPGTVHRTASYREEQEEEREVV